MKRVSNNREIKSGEIIQDPQTGLWRVQLYSPDGDPLTLIEAQSQEELEEKRIERVREEALSMIHKKKEKIKQEKEVKEREREEKRKEKELKDAQIREEKERKLAEEAERKEKDKLLEEEEKQRLLEEGLIDVQPPKRTRKKRENEKKKGSSSLNSRIKAEAEKALAETIERKLAGEDSPTIMEFLCTEYGYSYGSADRLIHQAFNIIRARALNILEETVDLHLSRYEQLYKWFRENGYIKYAEKALRSREKIMGLGDNVYHIKIEQEESRKKYRPDLLTEQERKRMEELTSKIIRTKTIERKRGQYDAD